jgi:hypothetical protein
MSSYQPAGKSDQLSHIYPFPHQGQTTLITHLNLLTNFHRSSLFMAGVCTSLQEALSSEAVAGLAKSVSLPCWWLIHKLVSIQEPIDATCSMVGTRTCQGALPCLSWIEFGPRNGCVTQVSVVSVRSWTKKWISNSSVILLAGWDVSASICFADDQVFTKVWKKLHQTFHI